MPSAILNAAAFVSCAHGGAATPTQTSLRVQVSGAPAVTIDAPYAIAGCPFAPPSGNGPCVSGSWLTGASRVSVEGRPIAVANGQSICEPTGAAMIATSAQTRVRAG